MPCVPIAWINVSDKPVLIIVVPIFVIHWKEYPGEAVPPGLLPIGIIKAKKLNT